MLSINGAVPNVNGEITIAPAGESGEGAVDSCVHVETIEHGVVLSNPCATPCCDKEAYLGLHRDLHKRIERSSGQVVLPTSPPYPPT